MKNRRNVILIFILVILLAAIGIAVVKKGVVGKSGADIEVTTGAGGMPPETSPGTILAGEKFTVVFTEPFSSLENWQAAKVVKEVSTTSGKASINLAPGKYGVYFIYNDQKILYDDLQLENPRNDIQRDKQGPWYIEIGILRRTKLKFSVNPQPV